MLMAKLEAASISEELVKVHIHSLTAKTFEDCHASKSFVVPHVIKVQKMADPYIQGARKFTQPYFNQVISKDFKRSVREKFIFGMAFGSK